MERKQRYADERGCVHWRGSHRRHVVRVYQQSEEAVGKALAEADIRMVEVVESVCVRKRNARGSIPPTVNAPDGIRIVAEAEVRHSHCMEAGEKHLVEDSRRRIVAGCAPSALLHLYALDVYNSRWVLLWRRISLWWRAIILLRRSSVSSLASVVLLSWIVRHA